MIDTPRARESLTAGVSTETAGGLERSLAALETMAAYVAAQQIRISARLYELAERADAEQRDRGRAEFDGTHIPPRPRRLSGLSMVVGAACKVSPSAGSRLLDRSRILVHSMPVTLDLLAIGVLTGARAFVLVDAAAVLDEDMRRELDARIGREQSEIATVGLPRLREVAAAWVAEIDSAAVLRRRDRARENRRVSCSALPDGMARVSVTAPVEQCAMVMASLRARADQLVATGGAAGRTAGQVCVDLAVTRMSGQSIAEVVPVTVNLVVSDATLLGGGDEPGRLTSGAVIPAPLARALVRDAALTPPSESATVDASAPEVVDGDPPVPRVGDFGARARRAVLVDLLGDGAFGPALDPRGPFPRSGQERTPPKPAVRPPDPILEPAPRAALEVERDAALAEAAWARQVVTTAGLAALRVVYACPQTGALTALRSRSRTFPAALAAVIDIRDAGRCRTPYCGAPIRHHDHVRRHAEGGETSLANGSGLCVRCNIVKDAQGLTASVTPAAARHTYRVITPGGLVHKSSAPRLPRPSDSDVPVAVDPPDGYRA